MSTVASTQLQLTREDHSDIDSIVQNTLRGHVYQLEREDGSSHASIMKYNLNRVNGPTHLEELCQRYSLRGEKKGGGLHYHKFVTCAHVHSVKFFLSVSYM